MADDEHEAAKTGELITQDRACPTCGYNLRTLRVGAVCPECGQRIPEPRRDSADSPRFSFTDSICGPCLWAVFVTCMSSVFWVGILNGLTESGEPPRLPWTVFVTLYACAIGGSLLICSLVFSSRTQTVAFWVCSALVLLILFPGLGCDIIVQDAWRGRI